MKLIGRIELPADKGPGGFDHAAVHGVAGRLFVAHTANDAVDVIDCVSDQYLFSIPGLAGVAGALVSEELGLIFTSNRGDDTVGIIHDGGGQLQPLKDEEREVYSQMRAMEKSSYARINGFQDNIAQGRPNQWRCRAGASSRRTPPRVSSRRSGTDGSASGSRASR